MSGVDWRTAEPEEVWSGLLTMRDWKAHLLPKQPFLAEEECILLERAAVFMGQMALIYANLPDYVKERFIKDASSFTDKWVETNPSINVALLVAEEVIPDMDGKPEGLGA